MLMPKRVKYRRVQLGRMKGKATRGTLSPTVSSALWLRSPAGSSPIRSKQPVSP